MADRASHPLTGTYRLQLSADLDLAQAATLVDYLADLGVSHLYASPYLQAGKGSTHGYDVADHRSVSAELGGEDARERLVEALDARGLGQLLDIVPNHMAVTGVRNDLWWDLLENGPYSRYASFFDIDWHPADPRLYDRVLVPILGDHYGRVLASDALSLSRDGARFTVSYYDHQLPLAPHTLDAILEPAAIEADSDTLAYLADALRELPTGRDRATLARRWRDTRVLMAYLADLLLANANLADAVDESLADIEADPKRLDNLLSRQHYHIAHWRTADTAINYRRFFSINTLVGVRVERPQVFDHTHDLVLGWLRSGQVQGLRIDHIDGLRDPAGYLLRLRREAPEAWLLVEKILEPDEELPEGWPVGGTTGYEFIRMAGGLFVNPAGMEPLTRLYAELTDEPTDWKRVERQGKQDVIGESFAGEIERLTWSLAKVAASHWSYRDIARDQLREAIIEMLVAFPVYRTYAQPGERTASASDRAYVQQALEDAQQARADLDPLVWQLLGRLLLVDLSGPAEAEWVLRFQQTSGPIMAKGVEDTALYRYNRLISLNEVGGHPQAFGTDPEAFHAWCLRVQERWPETMLTSSTHDTKRSEDVRLRIHLLSEMPEVWAEAVRRWSQRAERYRRAGLPDRNAEYLLYQTLVGAWPIGEERLQEYLLKAAREAKQHTSWTGQCLEYEQALHAFIHSLLADAELMADVARVVEPLVRPGRISALAQTLLRYTAPGVPDLYQGTEIWDNSLVDPDNRRPVDMDVRRRLLAALSDATPEEVMARFDEGLPKMHVIQRALALRARRPELFGREGDYQPLYANGRRADHVVAFVRGGGALTVVPRWVLSLTGGWDDTAIDLPAGRWTNVLTGEQVQGRTELESLLQRFPVALLTIE